jgi:hypothetical protein
MTGKKSKRRLRQVAIQQGLSVRVPEDTDSLRPVWSFRHLREPYSLDHVARLGKSQAVLESLWRRESLTWGELKLEDRKGLGWESAPKVVFKQVWPFPARDWMIFRIANKGGRIVGYRDGRVFSIVWIDCEFTLYQHD